MSYQCRACSYSGQKFPRGVCPACGSAQVLKAASAPAGTARRKPWSLLALIGLWGCLGFAIWQKLGG